MHTTWRYGVIIIIIIIKVNVNFPPEQATKAHGGKRDIAVLFP
jgi:hypothetical protein